MIKQRAEAQTKELGRIRGECPDATGPGIRNMHLLAVAPNASSSILCGTSPSVEPISANVYTQRNKTGLTSVRNKHLDKLLTELGQNTEAVWHSIMVNNGSVQHLDFLDEYTKSVFKTAFELDQEWVVQHAADRQKFICQAQSINLFFPVGVPRSVVNSVHLNAWKKGLKGLYYLRTESAGKLKDVSAKIESSRLKEVVITGFGGKYSAIYLFNAGCLCPLG